MPVEEVAKENVVDGSHIRRPQQDGKSKTMLPRPCSNVVRICGIVQVHGQKLKRVHCPILVALVESDPILVATSRQAVLRGDGPKVDQHRLTAQGGQTALLPAEIRK